MRVEAAEAQARAELAELRASGNAGCCALLRARMRLLTRVFIDTPSTIVYLVLVGVIAAIAGAGIDGVVSALHSARTSLLAPLGGTAAWAFAAAAWGIGMACLAASVGHLVTSRADGSGIPALKSILAGTWLHRQLSLPTLLAKTVGLVFALASGLPVGKEGPFVHMAATAAAKLWRLPCFAPVRRSDPLRRQALAAAVAAGVTATLGAPIGGVLFSVEATATYYQVSSLWRGILCSLACVFAFEAIQALSDDELFQPTELKAPDLSWQLVAFAALGAGCGVLASLLVRATAAAHTARDALMRRCPSPATRYALVAAVAALAALAAAAFPVLALRDRDVINALFQDDDGFSGRRAAVAAPASNTSAAADAAATPPRLPSEWGEGGALVGTLLAFAAARTLLTPLAISLPMPAGLFTPVFALGAAVGRLTGELLRASGATDVVPGAYAVVGAAALTAGTTQTLSVAVIVFELTRQIHHMLPVLVAVVAAYLVASLFTVSVYDALMAVSGLPFLPRLLSAEDYARRAGDIARPAPVMVRGRCTGAAAAALLAATAGSHDDSDAAANCCRRRALVRSVGPGEAARAGRVVLVSLADEASEGQPRATGPAVEEFAVVDGMGSMRLLGSVRRETLRRALEAAGAGKDAGRAEVVALAVSLEGLGAGDGEGGRPARGREAGAAQGARGGAAQGAEPASVSLGGDEGDRGAPLAGAPGWMAEPVSFDGLGWADDEEEAAAFSAGAGGGGGASGAGEAASRAPGGRAPALLDGGIVLPADSAPMEVSWRTPLPKAHYLLATCVFPQLLVTRGARLVGVIPKDGFGRMAAPADEAAREAQAPAQGGGEA